MMCGAVGEWQKESERENKRATEREGDSENSISRIQREKLYVTQQFMSLCKSS